MANKSRGSGQGSGAAFRRRRMQQRGRSLCWYCKTKNKAERGFCALGQHSIPTGTSNHRWVASSWPEGWTVWGVIYIALITPRGRQDVPRFRAG